MITRTINIGLHRNNRRLWLEGQWLADAGFIRGQHYTVTESTEKHLVLTADAQGKRRISGKSKNGKDLPIIDINSSEVVKLAVGAAVVSMPELGTLIIRPE